MESNNTREAPGSTKTPYSNNPLTPPFPVPLQMTVLPNSTETLQRSVTNQPKHPVPQFPSSSVSIQPITGAPYSYLVPGQGNLLSMNQEVENPSGGINYPINNPVISGIESSRPATTGGTTTAPVSNSTLLNGILHPTPLTGGLSLLNPEKIFSQDTLVLSQLNSIAEFLAAKGDFANSIQYYERITVLDAENGAAWTALGHCYLLTDNLQKAFTAYQKALYTLSDVRDPQLWYGIGLLYDKVGCLCNE